MGFKCPNCHKDFGFNRKKLTQHLEEDSGECSIIADLTLKNIDIRTGKKRRKNSVKKTRIPKPRYSSIDTNHNFRKTSIVTGDDGYDTVECINCGLEGKRNFQTYKFDKRLSNKKIEKCG